MHGLEIFNHLGCSVGGMYIKDKREWMWSMTVDSELFRKQSACMYAGSQPIKTHVLEKSLNISDLEANMQPKNDRTII